MDISNKEKVDMLEKEANLLLKELVVYLGILGSVIVFLVKNLTIGIFPLNEDSLEIQISIFFIFLIVIIIFAVLFTKFVI